MRQHLGGLAQQCLLGLPGHGPDECGQRVALLCPRGRLGARRLFDDRVRVRPAHAERGDAESLGPAGLRPVRPLGQQLDGTGGPVDVRGGLVDVQRLGQRAVAHRLDHFDDAGDTGGRLGVAEVGLDRTEQDRVVALPVPAVGGEQCLRLDRVAERRARAVGLDRVDLVGGESGVRQRFLDDALLGGAVGGGEAVARTVLVHGGTADDGQYLVPVAPGVRQPLQEQQAGALGPAGPVGGLGEGLAAAVGRQPALPAELDEGTRGRHDRHAAGQRQRALALTQCVRGQVQGDERRRARRVHGDGRAFETEGVRHPSRDHAGRRARQTVPLDALRGELQQGGVVLAAGTGEHADPCAGQRHRVDACPFERLPRRLEEQPLLRVHGQGLAGADSEQAGVELSYAVDETARPDVGRAGLLGVGIVDAPGVPASVVRER